MNGPGPQGAAQGGAVGGRNALLRDAVIDAVVAVGGDGPAAGWLAVDCAAQLVALARETLEPTASGAQRDALAAAAAALDDVGGSG